MLRRLALAVLSAIVLSAAAQTAPPPAFEERTLTLPHALHAGESAWIEVLVGRISAGREIVLSTAEGRELGTISPYGLRRGAEAGMFTVPLPAEVLGGKKQIRIRLAVPLEAASTRAPTAEELVEVQVRTSDPSR